MTEIAKKLLSQSLDFSEEWTVAVLTSQTATEILTAFWVVSSWEEVRSGL